MFRPRTPSVSLCGIHCVTSLRNMGSYLLSILNVYIYIYIHTHTHINQYDFDREISNLSLFFSYLV